MLLSTFDSIGEKTINKIAEIAFKTQIKDAKYLRVEVKTDPQLLAKGVLESLHIDGNGLIMQENIPLEKMNITLNHIAVNPLKALMGNVQLTQPSKGKASLILSEKNIETALNVNHLNKRLRGENTEEKVEFTKVDCRILEDGRISLKTKFRSLNPPHSQSVCVIIKPRVCDSQGEIVIDDVMFTQGSHHSSLIVNVLLKEVAKIFNLKNLLLDGISLKVSSFRAEEGKLILFANAAITHLPKR